MFHNIAPQKKSFIILGLIMHIMHYASHFSESFLVVTQILLEPHSIAYILEIKLLQLNEISLNAPFFFFFFPPLVVLAESQVDPSIL